MDPLRGSSGLETQTFGEPVKSIESRVVGYFVIRTLLHFFSSVFQTKYGTYLFFFLFSRVPSSSVSSKIVLRIRIIFESLMTIFG
jgi:hypothetical protein